MSLRMSFILSFIRIHGRNNLHYLTSEPEAAAVHCVHLTDLHRLRVGQTFMICDAGGGTVVSILHLSSNFVLAINITLYLRTWLYTES